MNHWAGPRIDRQVRKIGLVQTECGGLTRFSTGGKRGRNQTLLDDCRMRHRSSRFLRDNLARRESAIRTERLPDV